jgi:hypothetical protein
LPHHWHLACSKEKTRISFVVRNGYEEIERKMMFEMGYDVNASSCNDHTHLGQEPRRASEVT